MAQVLERYQKIPDHILTSPAAEYNSWVKYAKERMSQEFGMELLRKGEVKFDTVSLPPSTTGMPPPNAPAETPHLWARFEFEPLPARRDGTAQPDRRPERRPFEWPEKFPDAAQVAQQLINDRERELQDRKAENRAEAEAEARVHHLREGRVLEIEGLQKWFEELETKMVEGASAAIFFHYVEGKLAERLKTLKGRLE